MNKKEELDVRSLNHLILLARKLLSIAYFMFIILAAYLILIFGSESGIFSTILSILKTLSPLFIGICIAWLFNPIVTKLQKKGMSRGLAAVFLYLVTITVFSIVMSILVPALLTQITDFANNLPSIISDLGRQTDKFFISLGEMINSDGLSLKQQFLGSINVDDLTSSLPANIINSLSGFLSGLLVFFVSIIIGFFLLVSFDKIESVLGFIPKRLRDDTVGLVRAVDAALSTYVVGTILDCTFIFIITAIGLYLVGLKGALLFGLFCGITNVIPYLGPYLGGAPAVIFGFAQSTTTGLLVLLVIAVIQFLEGNLLQPLILSKTTKLHPVSIMISLLIFGYFFGMVGMLISTPTIATFKAMFLYFDKKYGILKSN